MVCVFSVVGEERAGGSLHTQEPLASGAAHCNRWPLEKGHRMRSGLGDLVSTDWEMVILQKGDVILTSHPAPSHCVYRGKDLCKRWVQESEQR